MRKVLVVLLTVLLAILLTSINGLAASLKTEQAVRDLTDGIMKTISAGDFKSGFNKMKPYVPIPEAEFDSGYLSSQAQRDQYGFRYGKSIGYEFIGMQKIGASLIRLQYIEKTEKTALPWVFYFYLSPSGWTLNAFQWNDNIKLLFESN